MRLIISIIIVLLIPFNTFICEIIYADDIKSWWFLRLDIYSIIMAWIFYILTSGINIYQSRHYCFVFYQGMALTSSDFIDRWFLNIRTVTITDFIFLFTFTIIGIKKYYPETYTKYIFPVMQPVINKIKKWNYSCLKKKLTK